MCICTEILVTVLFQKSSGRSRELPNAGRRQPPFWCSRGHAAWQIRSSEMMPVIFLMSVFLGWWSITPSVYVCAIDLQLHLQLICKLCFLIEAERVLFLEITTRSKKRTFLCKSRDTRAETRRERWAAGWCLSEGQVSLQASESILLSLSSQPDRVTICLTKTK